MRIEIHKGDTVRTFTDRFQGGRRGIVTGFYREGPYDLVQVRWFTGITTFERVNAVDVLNRKESG